MFDSVDFPWCHSPAVDLVTTVVSVFVIATAKFITTSEGMMVETAPPFYQWLLLVVNMTSVAAILKPFFLKGRKNCLGNLLMMICHPFRR